MRYVKIKESEIEAAKLLIKIEQKQGKQSDPRLHQLANSRPMTAWQARRANLWNWLFTPIRKR